MIRGRYKAIELQVGLRVGAVSGPGQLPEQNPGVVTRHVPTKWGGHWDVRMDSAAIEFIACSGRNDMGIGRYAIDGLE